MKFSDSSTARTYSDRFTDNSWLEWCRKVLKPTGKDVVDVGCGGGIYSKGFVLCGAKSVLGIDSSEQYIEEAGNFCPDADFQVAQCECTGIESESADIVFERALIHHLDPDQLLANAEEIIRILRRGGLAVVQDRTLENAMSQDDTYWLRRELMNMFPRLIDFEAKRRPCVADYSQTLLNAGFTCVEVTIFSEIRKRYASKEQFDEELAQRKGKSILFRLSDDELRKYRARIMDLCPNDSIVECDQWTIWTGKNSIQQGGAPDAYGAGDL